MDFRFASSAQPSPYDDTRLIERIRRSYSLAIETPVGSTDSMWLRGPLFEMRCEIHDALTASATDDLTQILRDPGRTDLHYGFEDLSRTFAIQSLPTLDRARFAASQFLGLLELGRATGLRRVRHHDQVEPELPRVGDLLNKFDGLFGFHIIFPNPFPNEPGLATTRGIIGYRGPAALYQAWRIKQLAGTQRSPRVVEIGGGLGRTAYYARKFGITDYTIVDIPMTLVAQANFLGRVLGEDSIALFGEVPHDAGRVKLLPPSAFLQSHRQYDLALNVDSMTEMARDTAQAYCDAIHARATTFLSINHEGLGFTVAELMPGGMFQRTPYWMRPGYVEELAGRYPNDTRGRRLYRSVRRAASSGKVLTERLARRGMTVSKPS